jgi:hypothetical protein
MSKDELLLRIEGLDAEIARLEAEAAELTARKSSIELQNSAPVPTADSILRRVARGACATAHGRAHTCTIQQGDDLRGQRADGRGAVPRALAAAAADRHDGHTARATIPHTRGS